MEKTGCKICLVRQAKSPCLAIADVIGTHCCKKAPSRHDLKTWQMVKTVQYDVIISRGLVTCVHPSTQWTAVSARSLRISTAPQVWSTYSLKDNWYGNSPNCASSPLIICDLKNPPTLGSGLAATVRNSERDINRRSIIKINVSSPK